MFTMYLQREITREQNQLMINLGTSFLPNNKSNNMKGKILYLLHSTILHWMLEINQIILL